MQIWIVHGPIQPLVKRGIPSRMVKLFDVEHAVLHGEITRIERDDPRGTKYVIEGIAADEPLVVGVVGRFLTTGRYVIITVYGITDGHEDI